MKFERKFEAKNNELFFVDGTPFPVAGCTALTAASCRGKSAVPADVSRPFAVEVPWTAVGLDEEHYDEAFLADFRDFLKALEEKGGYAFVVPVADRLPSTDGEKENLTASFKHCARRIKDCVSVIGFAVPECVDAVVFMDELKAKHAQYVFFSRDEKLLSDGAVARF